MSLPSLKCLQFRHDCQHLGCANPSCPQCALCQRRRCVGNFAPKYLAPCDILEAKCGAQIYVVVIDTANGALIQSGLDDAFLRLTIVDGKKLAAEGEWEEALDRCQLLINKAGHPLLSHGRSGAYTEENAVIVPMIAGQAMLPDLKVTDSSEALLTGRAPPFRLLARVIQRGGLPFPGIAPVLSEPFVVATARVKGAAKAEIPHVGDHVGKLEGLGVQTQKKLEDIAAAAQAAGVPNLQVPVNSVTKVGQFKELVEIAERSKSLRETLKQVLRLTKGWDVARDHARKAVTTDIQLRVFHPDGRIDVGLVYRCSAFNVVDINQPVGLLRRRRAEKRVDQELVDVIWLETDVNAWPDAVRRIVPRAAAAWWHEGHPGWAFLPLTVNHIPQYGPNGKPATQMSSYSFTIKTSPPVSGGNIGMPGGSGGVNVAGLPPGMNFGAFPGATPPGMVPQIPPGGEQLAFPGAVPTSAIQPQGVTIGGPIGMEGLTQQNNGATRNIAAAANQAGPSNANNNNINALPAFGSFPSVPPELLASLGMGGGGLGSLLPLSGGSEGELPPLPSVGGFIGKAGEESLSPFEDPSFQQLMQMVAANNPDSGDGRGAAPRSGDSDGGSKGKRKADTSLDTWMAMHKSLDIDLDLPPNLRLESLPGSNSGGSGGAGPRTIVGSLLPVVGSSLDPPPAAAAMAAAAAIGGGDGGSAPFSEFLATVQQQRAQQRAAKIDRKAEALAGGSSDQAAGDARAKPAPLSGGEVVEAAELPDNAPARMPTGVTMGELREMFARATRQEISFNQVEEFLKTHGLLSGAAAVEEEPIGMETAAGNVKELEPSGEGSNQEKESKGFTPGLDHSGLDDMRSIEDELPAYK